MKSEEKTFWSLAHSDGGLVTMAAFCGFCRKTEKEMTGVHRQMDEMSPERHSAAPKICKKYKRMLGLG